MIQSKPFVINYESISHNIYIKLFLMNINFIEPYNDIPCNILTGRVWFKKFTYNEIH